MDKIFSIALFGENSLQDQSVLFKDWAYYILKLCESENIVPDYNSIRLTTGKKSQIKLPTFSKRLKNLNNSDLVQLGIMKSKTDFSYLITGFDFDASIDSREYLDSTYLGFNTHTLSELYRKRFIILRKLCEFSKIDYGFCFDMDLKYGPGCYVSGMLVDRLSKILDEFERESSSLWFNFQPEAIKAVKKGKLRYIYEYNLINLNHIERKVQGRSLGDWISLSADNGKLEKLTDDLFIWSVLPSQLDFIVKVLINEKVFLLDKEMKPNFD